MNAQTRVSDSSSSRAGAASAVNAQRRGFAAGITLTEALVSMVIVAVVAMGGLSYEYLAAKHSLIARAQTTATRTAQLLIEDWKSAGGADKYDLTKYDPSAGIPDINTVAVSFYTAVYSIKVDGLPMMVTLERLLVPSLFYVDLADEAGVSLWELSVHVEFGEVGQAEPWMGIPPVTLTTFGRADAA